MHDKLASCEGLTFRLIGASGDSRSLVRISPCFGAGCNGRTAWCALRRGRNLKKWRRRSSTQMNFEVQNTIEILIGNGNTCSAAPLIA